jgi:hypothetical protein
MDRAAFAHRHLLANALTGGGVEDIHHYLVELAPGDRLLLDTDGVHDNLTSAELEQVLAATATAPEAAERVVAAAWYRSEEAESELGRAKPDDVTVLVLDVRSLEQSEGAAGAYRLSPGGSVSLSLIAPPDGETTSAGQPKQYLVTAADLQLLVARRDNSWWAMQPGAAHGELGSWSLLPGQTLEFGRAAPGGFLIEPSEQVSRRHVALTLNEAGDMLSVTDLNSTNGTAVLGW